MPKRTWPAIAVVLGFVSLASPGCTSLSEYVRNGFKVGPNYGKPPAPVADTWIDAANPKVRLGDPNIAAWWCVFDDPVLNELVQRAYSQNLTLRAAGFRILEARAQLGIATGNILPQSQTFTASYSRNEISLTRTGVVSLSPATTGGGATSFASAGAKRFFDSFAGALNLSWELDFWGKFRRAVESADASLDASVENYDFVLVMLLSDVATNYVEYRTLQKRLDLARKNVEEQTPMVEIMERRFKASVKDSLPDYNQLKANLENTRALVPQLETLLRQVNDKLCILLGIPMRDLGPELGDGRVIDAQKMNVVRIPSPREEQVVVGIPANLLLRRPDVRRAERQLAAQSAQIGIAAAEWYPHIVINGNIGLQSSKLSTLFNTLSWAGTIGPSLTWNILNYGRILNNVRFQDATFQELAATYQNTVLTANEEAEDALIGYLNALDRSKYLTSSANAASEVTRYLSLQKEKGFGPDYSAFINRLFTVQNFKVLQQDAAAQAEGDIALNLILLYRAMGGGWQIRLGAGCDDVLPRPQEVPPAMPPKGEKKIGAPAPVGLRPANLGPPTALPPVSQDAPEVRRLHADSVLRSERLTGVRETLLDEMREMRGARAR